MADQTELIQFLEEVKIDLISQQNALGIRASGASANSLQVRNPSKPVLVGDDYWVHLMKGQGRRPGAWPNLDNIKDWIQDKGLTIENSLNQTAFLIGRKIAEKGTDIFSGKSEGIDFKKIVNQRLLDTSGKIARRKANDILKPFRK